MKLFRTILASAAAIALSSLPAIARDQYVQDAASMFDPATVAQVNARIGSFNAQTGKEVVVVTVPSVTGGSMADVRAAAEKTFAEQSVNGVLIFIDKGDRKDIIIPDRAGIQSGWFSSETLASIRQSMEAQFKQEDYNGGLTTGVGGVLGVYRSHLSSLQRGGSAAYAPVSRTSTSASTGGVHINMFWIIIFIIVGYLIIRSITRPRYYGPPGAPGQGGTPAGGMPGGPGAGYGGYGYGGGGSFFSGLLGGLGGAWLGNEMFNRGEGGGTGNEAGMIGGAPADPGGFTSDAGQADLGGSSGGDWGGGGFGGGDFGGGGGGDSGGGW